jgi:hypothetical protein
MEIANVCAMISPAECPATLAARVLRFPMLIASGVALNAAVSLDPLRWFFRICLLAGGLSAGMPALRGLCETGRHGARAGGSGGFLRRGRGALALVFWSKVIGLVLHFLGRDALHYFRFDEADFGTLWPRRAWLIPHICGGMIALITGPLQFWSGLRGMAPRFHRWTGRLYLLGVLLAAGSAFYLARFIMPDEGALLAGVSLMVLATVWLCTTVMAVSAVVHRRFDAHREWMIRSYVVACAFVNLRWLGAWPLLATLGTARERLPVIIWASWAAPLFVAEIFLQWKRAARVAANGAPPDSARG